MGPCTTELQSSILAFPFQPIIFLPSLFSTAKGNREPPDRIKFLPAFHIYNTPVISVLLSPTNNHADRRPPDPVVCFRKGQVPVQTPGVPIQCGLPEQKTPRYIFPTCREGPKGCRPRTGCRYSSIRPRSTPRI